MQPNFSLNDQQIREMLASARASNDADLLRGHIYQLVKLRKELALYIYQLSTSRTDLAAINESATATLAMDKKTGLLALLDRKGLIKELNSQLKKQLETMSRLAADKEALQAQLAATASQEPKESSLVGALRAELASAQNQLDNLQQANQRFATDAARLERENSSLSTQQRQLETRIEDLETLVSDLKAQLAAAHAAQSLAANYQESTPATDDRKQAAAPSEFIRDLFEKQITALLDRNADLDRELALYKEQSDALSQQVRAAESTISQMQAQAATVDAERAQERRDAEALLLSTQSKLGELEHATRDYLARINNLTEENSRLQEDLSAVRRELAVARSESHEKGAEVRALTAAVAERDSRIAQIQAALDRGEIELADARSQISNLNHEKVEISSELATLAERMRVAIDQSTRTEATLTLEINSLTEQLRAKSHELNQARDTNQGLERTVRILNNRTDKLVQLKRQLEQSLKLGSEDRNQMRELTRSLSLENAVQRQELAQLKELNKAQAAELSQLGARLRTASKVVVLQGPESRKDAELSIAEMADHALDSISGSENSGPSS